MDDALLKCQNKTSKKLVIMKTVILTLATMIVSFYGKAQADNATADVAAAGTTITVTVPVQSTDGKVVFGLYNEATFMKAGPLVGLHSAIEDGKATVTFTDVAPGIYAISLFHDKNNNNQMDFEPNGMPKEMYGVSNNVMSYGPPQWSDAKFEVGSEPIEMEIRM